MITNDTNLHYTKTRIAPTPSGFLHVGNIMSFAITAALAREYGAGILLRIDDLDQARSNDDHLQDIFDTLEFLKIPWNEGPRNSTELKNSYSQICRMDKYAEALARLKNSGKIFACRCSRKQLAANTTCDCISGHIPLDETGVNWRLITSEAPVAVKDPIGKVIHAALPAEMKNFVVRKKDGFPAYQLTSVVDDLLFNVDLIVRGEDLWASTLAQHQLAIALGEPRFKDIAFYHHRLITDEQGNKLSKSAGAASVLYMRRNGMTAEEIYQAIGKNIGSKSLITNWQQLGEALLMR